MLYNAVKQPEVARRFWKEPVVEG